ncbi:unnamed protein product [Schistosoma margrebowiei]|uniref:Uncharacterized protein n=1 Tax=Schistosoma margrebowiei TaxID=48269 RepID=A0A3P7ZAQ9_9TREM|nr:unnamed protein product [Schistosoma margrebowiei]
MGLFSWMCLHLRFDVHSGTRTQFCSLQTPSRYPLQVLEPTSTLRCRYIQSQIGRNERPGSHC